MFNIANLKKISIWHILICIAVIVVFDVSYRILHDTVFIFIAISVVPLFLGHHYYDKLQMPVRAAWIGVALAITIVFGSTYVGVMTDSIQNPPRWDFEVFWLNGKVGIEGYNFYESEGYYKIANEFLDVNEGFEDEVLKPSFVYPPPTMFLFIPLGGFDINSALVLWHTLQTIFLIIAIGMLWRLFYAEQGWRGLLFVTAGTLACNGVWLTIRYAQLNFMMLTFSLLFIYNYKSPRSGIWLALGILVKPIVGVLGIYSLLKGQWKSVIFTIATLFILSIAAALAFGSEVLSTYITDPPSARLPYWLYLENFFQSWLSITAKLTNYDGTWSLLMQPVFLVPTLIVTGITSYVVYRVKDNPYLVLSLLLVLGLIVYPNTQIYYSPLLLIPLFYIWQTQSETISSLLVKLVFIVVIFVLFSLKGGMLFFVANVISWVMLLWFLIPSMRIPLKPTP